MTVPLPREIDRRLERNREGRGFSSEHTTHLLRRREPSTASPPAAADLRPPRAIPVAVGSEDDGPPEGDGDLGGGYLEGTGMGPSLGLADGAVGLDASSAPVGVRPPRLLRSLGLVSKAREREAFVCLFDWVSVDV